MSTHPIPVLPRLPDPEQVERTVDAVEELTLALERLAVAWDGLPAALRAEIDSGYQEAIEDMLDRLTHRLAAEAASKRKSKRAAKKR